MEIFFLVLVALAVIIIMTGVRVVPQQSAFVVERLGKFHIAIHAGVSYIIPFIDKIAYIINIGTL